MHMSTAITVRPMTGFLNKLALTAVASPYTCTEETAMWPSVYKAAKLTPNTRQHLHWVGCFVY